MIAGRYNYLALVGDHFNQLRRYTPTRSVEPAHFQTIVSALRERKRLQVSHYHRGNDSQVSRELSPQRLVYYRNNWYLDAWCHLRDGLRRFGMDAINRPEVSEQPAKEIPRAVLERELSSGYGIFAGRADQRAALQSQDGPLGRP
jgi:predicted DNA-binding transcriptional regulator YafY